MPAIKQFSSSDISKLINNNADRFGQRNTAIIMSGIYWGLTPIEIIKLTVEDVIAPNGQFYQIWVLPAHSSFNGIAREIQTRDHVIKFFQNYVDLRLNLNWGISNLNSYQTLDPKSAFFFNDKESPYKLTRTVNKETGRVVYQARSMVDHLKKMIAKTDIQGANASSYRDTYIRLLWENGCGWNELKLATGIQNKKTLEKKVRPEHKQLEQIYKQLCKGIKVPHR